MVTWACGHEWPGSAPPLPLLMGFLPVAIGGTNGGHCVKGCHESEFDDLC
jgi:hypothetical protein